MTEEQKRFKILKRESYEQQISKENAQAIIQTFAIGLAAAGAILLFSEASQRADLTSKLFEIGLGYITAELGVYRLKDVLEAISRKTMLEGKVEDITTELEMLENEESRCMRR